MLLFLLLIIPGFVCHLASAFTAAYSERWGDRKGRLATVLLRDVFGIPVWAMGFALAAWTPSPFLFPPTGASRIAGWLMIAAGGALIAAALATIRLRAAAPKVRDSLAETGIYARIRHPIHAGTILEFFGILLARPTASIALACMLGLVWILVQTRFEERDLLRRIPEYREYRNRVPCFLPRWKS